MEDGGTAQAVPVPGPRAPGSAARKSSSGPTRPWRRRPDCSSSRTAKWKGRMEKSSRPRSRSGRKGNPAQPYFEVQFEFLANMSHELRTPLNSLLILAHQLSDNPEGNPDACQVQFSKTIHAAGMDLMGLINDILDLSKIESGTVTVEVDEVQCPKTCASMWTGHSGTWPRTESSRSISTSGLAAAGDRHRLQAAASGPQEPALECVQVHAAPGAGAAAGRAGDERVNPEHIQLNNGKGGDRPVGVGHGHRHRQTSRS